MARPRTNRTHQRVVRLTADEDRQLATAAAETGLSPAAVLRLAGLRKLPRQRGSAVIDREAQRELWKQVSGMARNLNQLTKHAHSGQLRPGELDGLRDEMRAVVQIFFKLAGTGGGSKRGNGGGLA